MVDRDDETHDRADLTAESQRIWNANAEWWDDRIGDGNDFQIELIEPTTERLIGDVAGAAILDVGCGAGRFARRMAELGARVTAFDFSERFIARARQRTPDETDTIEYRVLDATDREQLLSLGAGRFEGAVASMALMDIATLDPLMEALAEVLRPHGWFVFSVMHPCFQPAEVCKFAEMSEADGATTLQNGVKVSRYRSETVWKGEGIVGQPERQYYFHRPLSLLFEPAFRNGFVVDAFEEPAFTSSLESGRPLAWHSMPEIPPVLVVRMRLASADKP